MRPQRTLIRRTHWPSAIGAFLERYRGELCEQFSQDLEEASLFVAIIDSEHFPHSRHPAFMECFGRSIPTNELQWRPGDSMLELFTLRVMSFPDMDPEDARLELTSALRRITPAERDFTSKAITGMFGLFLPRRGLISCRSFAHGKGHYYRYRIAEFKLTRAPDRVVTYLKAVASICPDSYFLSGPRASSLDIEVDVIPRQWPGHALSLLASTGLRVRKLRSAHEDVEKFLLNYDASTIACEVPIWFEPSEFSSLHRAIHQTGAETLTGHIDVLRLENDGKIGVWDYKPDISSESHAHVQVFLYALMLSKRTGLPLEVFRCGWFDASAALEFEAADATLRKSPRS
jgi:hypothetical protein